MGSLGVHPLCFSKSGEVLANELVAEVSILRVCKLLKVQGFAAGVDLESGLAK